MSSAVAYAKGRRTMRVLRDKTKFEVFDARWSAATGGGAIEVDWKIGREFNVPGIDDEVIEDLAEDDDTLASERDENDEELADVDLNDIFS